MILRERRAEKTNNDGIYLSTEKTRAIFPMARILFRMTSLRTAAVSPYQRTTLVVNVTHTLQNNTYLKPHVRFKKKYYKGTTRKNKASQGREPKEDEETFH